MNDKKASATGADSAGLPETAAPVIELREIADLIPYARNSRTHSDEQIAQLAGFFEDVGYVGAIVVRDGVIAKGHGSLSAIRKLLSSGKRIYPPPGRAQGARPYPAGMVPVIDASGWTDAQFRAFVIADNQLALNAGWNYEMLAVEIDELRDLDFDLSLVGFDQKHLNELIGTPNEPPPDGDVASDEPSRNLLMIECATEQELESLFEEMKERGMECKILS